MESPGKKFTDLVEIESIQDTDLTVVRNDTGVKKTPMQKLSDYIKQKFIGWVFSDLPTTDKTIPGALKELNSALKNKIIIGSYQNAMMIITNQTPDFNNGTATLNMESVASSYEKTILNAFVQLKNASSATITSAIVSDNTLTIKCSNLSGTPYDGTIPCTVLLLLV